MNALKQFRTMIPQIMFFLLHFVSIFFRATQNSHIHYNYNLFCSVVCFIFFCSRLIYHLHLLCGITDVKFFCTIFMNIKCWKRGGYFSMFDITAGIGVLWMNLFSFFHVKYLFNDFWLRITFEIMKSSLNNYWIFFDVHRFLWSFFSEVLRLIVSCVHIYLFD